MEYKYSYVIDSSKYDTEDLCRGIDLRRHVAGDLEEVGAFRIQEDWRRLVGPLERPFKGGLGPDISLITCAVPECLPDRLEVCSVGLEFGFIHDGACHLSLGLRGILSEANSLKTRSIRIFTMHH